MGTLQGTLIGSGDAKTSRGVLEPEELDSLGGRRGGRKAKKEFRVILGDGEPQGRGRDAQLPSSLPQSTVPSTPPHRRTRSALTRTCSHRHHRIHSPPPRFCPSLSGDRRLSSLQSPALFFWKTLPRNDASVPLEGSWGVVRGGSSHLRKMAKPGSQTQPSKKFLLLK